MTFLEHQHTERFAGAYFAHSQRKTYPVRRNGFDAVLFLRLELSRKQEAVTWRPWWQLRLTAPFGHSFDRNYRERVRVFRPWVKSTAVPINPSRLYSTSIRRDSTASQGGTGNHMDRLLRLNGLLFFYVCLHACLGAFRISHHQQFVKMLIQHWSVEVQYNASVPMAFSKTTLLCRSGEV